VISQRWVGGTIKNEEGKEGAIEGHLIEYMACKKLKRRQ